MRNQGTVSNIEKDSGRENTAKRFQILNFFIKTANAELQVEDGLASWKTLHGNITLKYVIGCQRATREGGTTRPSGKRNHGENRISEQKSRLYISNTHN